MMKIAKIIIFIIFTAPVFIWILLRPGELIREWSNVPSYFKENVKSLVTTDKLAKVYTERWNAFGPDREDSLSKVYYSRINVLFDDFFSLTTYFSPRLYFQSGDGGNFSPPRVEPIAIPMFAFWLLGVVALIKEKKYKPFFLILIFGLFVYIAGHRNFAFLFPVASIYSWISFYGVELSKNKLFKNVTYSLLGLYGMFLFGRMFLLK